MDVLMPQLGETVAEGKISKWFVAAGDAVKPGDNLFEIETDKVSMEVPAIAAGTLAAIHVQAGEVAPVGAVVAVIQGKGETVSLSSLSAPLTPAKAGSSEPESQLDPRLRGDERAAGSRARRPDGAVPRSALARAQLRPCAACGRHRRSRRSRGGSRAKPGSIFRTSKAPARTAARRIEGSGPHGRIVARDVETARSAAPACAPCGGEHRFSPPMSRSVGRSHCART